MNMATPEQHNLEIHKNLAYWQQKPLLKVIYDDFYTQITHNLARRNGGKIVELGSGIGNLKMRIPDAICTDLFHNPWIDQVENAYALSFPNGAVSDLILFDVFHHLQYPGLAFQEFGRVLMPRGRVILFEPAVSLLGLFVYGLFHHEPLALHKEIEWNAPEGFDPWASPYYAAQGNASRLFSKNKTIPEQEKWNLLISKKSSALAYVLSGGYSKPQLFPQSLFKGIKQIERLFDRFPVLFATRILVVLEKN